MDDKLSAVDAALAQGDHAALRAALDDALQAVGAKPLPAASGLEEFRRAQRGETFHF